MFGAVTYVSPPVHMNLCRIFEKLSYCKLIFDEYRNFVLFILSYSCARLYSNTPTMTEQVPSADNPVTGLLNNRTESHIRKALFAVLATLQLAHCALKPSGECSSITCTKDDYTPVCHRTDVVHKYISGNTLKVEEYPVEKECRE